MIKYSTLIFFLVFVTSFSLKADNPRPNIIWIMVEDMSPDFGYNGETLIKTPNVDKMANEGVIFNHAYVTAPVCSPSRSALITGMYQTSIGAHNHRSSRGPLKIELPDQVKTIPEYFREAGYYVCNQNLRNGNWNNVGKEDYNFDYNRDELYHGIDWKGRKEGQPFFSQIQLQGGKNRKVKLPVMVNPNDVVLPPHYPNDSVLREDWAAYLNSVKAVDIEVGRIFDRLKEESLLENTIVIFTTDHGISHARGKQFCYEEGAHVPLVIWGQSFVDKGIREDLVSHIDLAATSMYFAGVKIPDYMESKPLFGKDAIPREFVVTARDRCDETVDHIRSVRKGDYLYIKNYLHKRPLLQPCAYKDHKQIMVRLRELHKQGKLNSLQERLLFANERPYEELYDVTIDANQYVNLASDENMQEKLDEMRTILNDWEENTNDQGRTIESPEVYASTMEAVIKSLEGNTRLPNRAKVLRENVALMKKWAVEGK
jgi:arylsulfatase A-like enzyme